MSDERLTVRLERGDRAPAAARQAIRELAGDQPAAASQLPMLTLLASEVVTNAVVHPEVGDGAEVELEVVVGPERTGSS